MQWLMLLKKVEKKIMSNNLTEDIKQLQQLMEKYKGFLAFSSDTNVLVLDSTVLMVQDDHILVKLKDLPHNDRKYVTENCNHELPCGGTDENCEGWVEKKVSHSVGGVRFECGDLVVSTAFGEGRVTAIHNTLYPVQATFDNGETHNYTFSGFPFSDVPLAGIRKR